MGAIARRWDDAPRSCERTRMIPLAFLLAGLAFGALVGYYIGFEHAWMHSNRMKPHGTVAVPSPLSGKAKKPNARPARFYGNLSPKEALDLEPNSINKIKDFIHPSAQELEELQKNGE